MKFFLKTLVIVTFVLSTLSSQSFAFAQDDVFSDLEYAIDKSKVTGYISAVEALESMINNLEKESELLQEKMLEFESIRQRHLEESSQMFIEATKIKAEEDTSKTELNEFYCSYHEKWVEYLSSNPTGINKDEGSGEEIYTWMSSLRPNDGNVWQVAFGYDWGAKSSLVRYENLYHIYANIENIIKIETLIEASKSLKVGGISSSEYEELISDYNKRAAIKVDTWGKIHAIGQEATVYRLLKDIGTEYIKLLKDNVKTGYMVKMIENYFYRGRLMGKLKYNDEIGEVSDLKGEVYIQKYGTDKKVKFDKNMSLRPGDTISTSEKSYLTIRTKDGGIMTIGSKSIFTVNNSEVEIEEKKADDSTATLVKRTFMGYLGEGIIKYDDSASTIMRGADRIIDIFIGNSKLDNYNASVGIRSNVILSTNKTDIEIKLLEGHVDVDLVGTDINESIVTGESYSIKGSNNSSTVSNIDAKVEDNIFQKENIENAVDLSNSEPIVLYIDNPYIIIDGKQKEIDAQGSKPIIFNGRTIVPIRVLVEELGGTILWNGSESKITISLDNISVSMQIDSLNAYVNGEMKKLEVAPQIINGRTMIPLRFVVENLGCNVQWDSAERKITVN